MDKRVVDALMVWDILVVFYNLYWVDREDAHKVGAHKVVAHKVVAHTVVDAVHMVADVHMVVLYLRNFCLVYIRLVGYL